MYYVVDAVRWTYLLAEPPQTVDRRDFCFIADFIILDSLRWLRRLQYLSFRRSLTGSEGVVFYLAGGERVERGG